MALINCDKHGKQGVIHLCTHLHKQFEKKTELDITHQIKKDLSGMTIYLCDECVDKNNLENIEILDFDDLQKIGDDLWPICGKCLI
ncbi:hypothetical protein [Aliikangiella coralliicola]|uniref:Uncharacterized protein n=1 Tax=Aliikangiella coralliicola TaxID=2592383 RepID=A0A545UI56_9GAMM|nr:hypothetical protein [Aliikangiella coralliicola]TQV89113.1 hypothetical protein FLL46_03020 [Aliikangiella coralliicola]